MKNLKPNCVVTMPGDDFSIDEDVVAIPLSKYMRMREATLAVWAQIGGNYQLIMKERAGGLEALARDEMNQFYISGANAIPAMFELGLAAFDVLNLLQEPCADVTANGKE